MPMPHRSSKPSSRPVRRASPSCRSGVSSLLRLAQPASSRGAVPGQPVTAWLARAATVLSPSHTEVLHVRPAEFAPSQWLVNR